MRYERSRAHFSEAQLSELSFAVGVINFWNRLNIGFRNGPGSADEMLGPNEVRIEITGSARRNIRAGRPDQSFEITASLHGPSRSIK